MNIKGATGGTNQLQTMDATLLPGGTGVATVGLQRHQTTQVEQLTEAARQKVEQAKARATGKGMILDSFA